MYGVLHRGIERAGDSRFTEVITIIGVYGAQRDPGRRQPDGRAQNRRMEFILLKP